MSSAAILGTGLIGASLGMALREQGWVVTGWDPDAAALAIATDRQAVDTAAESLEAAVDGADLVVLASPLDATLSTLAHLETSALVTDVAGVKVPVVESCPPGMRFVGSHPMAGREHAGPSAASPALFRGASWIICPDRADQADVEQLGAVIKSIGAIPVVMSAERHDRVVATISHLPQLLAMALMNQVVTEPGALDLVSGSFRDLTRVAASDPGWWPEVLSANEANVGDAIDTLVAYLSAVREEMHGDQEALAERLSIAREQRREMAPSAVSLGVVLQDTPGEIAAVGRALEQSKADVRDLQLRHGLHGGGGVLTLSVRPGEAETLRAALIAEGFTLA